MKHAYLIMAHDNWEQLKTLVKLLDIKENALFIHIDKKAKNYPLEKIESICQLAYIKHINRKRVYWADYSQVEVTMDLIREATQADHFAYYHLMSGRDLPLKMQEEIHRFFDHHDKEFIGIVPRVNSYTISHVKYYHWFPHSSFYRKFKALKALNLVCVKIQCLFGINRIKDPEIEFVDGWTWFSITDDFAHYLIERALEIEKTYRHCLAPDEIFIQTIAWNSPYRDRLYDVSDLKNGSQRYVDWKRGTPYTFRNSDWEELMNSESMFARKFDERIDDEVIVRIRNALMLPDDSGQKG